MHDTELPEVDPVSGAPRDYEALFTHYRAFVAKTVRAAGVPEADVEDVVMDILTTFMAKESLEKYSYERLHDTHRPRRTGDSLPLDRTSKRFRPARFASYLRQFTYLNSLHHRDRSLRNLRREPSLLNDPDFSPGLPVPTVSFDNDVAVSVSLQKIFLGVSEDTRGGRVWTVGDVMTACAICFEETGSIDRKVVADLLGVAPASVRYMLKALRKALEEAGAPQVVQK